MEQATKDYFLYILKCFYLGDDCKEPEQEIDVDYLFKLAKIHDVKGIVFSMVGELEFVKNSPEYSQFRMEFFAIAQNGIFRGHDLEYVLNILNKNNIPHTLIKGAVVRNCYPSKELRTMSDVDLYVNKKYTDDLFRILPQEGIWAKGNHKQPFVNVFRYHETSFEIHESIASRNCIIHSADFLSFFDKIEQHVVHIDKSTYMLEPTYHVVFLVFHLLKHFECSGCGIRLFLDFPFFMDYYKDQIDYNLLKKYLKKLNLTDFCNGVFYFCNRIFGSDIKPVSDKVPDEEVFCLLVEKVISAGTFGFNQKETVEHKILKSGVDTNGKKSYFRILFPSREYMANNSNWSMKIPLVFLPVGYCVRIFRQIFKEKNTKEFLHAVKNSDNKEAELINQLGINK